MHDSGEIQLTWQHPDEILSDDYRFEVYMSELDQAPEGGEEISTIAQRPVLQYTNTQLVSPVESGVMLLEGGELSFMITEELKLDKAYAFQVKVRDHNGKVDPSMALIPEISTTKIVFLSPSLRGKLRPTCASTWLTIPPLKAMRLLF